MVAGRHETRRAGGEADHLEDARKYSTATRRPDKLARRSLRVPFLPVSAEAAESIYVADLHTLSERNVAAVGGGNGEVSIERPLDW